MILYTKTKKFEVRFASVSFTGDLWIGGFTDALTIAATFGDADEAKIITVKLNEEAEIHDTFSGFTQIKCINYDAGTKLYDVGLGKETAETT